MVRNGCGTCYTDALMSRFRDDSYWRPLEPIYSRLPDFGHPLTERFAMDLHLQDVSGARRGVWEKEPVEVREYFRDRARRLMSGDLSVVPTHLPPGYAAYQVLRISLAGDWIDAPPYVDDWG